MRILAVLLSVVFASVSGSAMAEQLAPYKDDLFAYPKILERGLDGAYLEVEYHRPRDLDGRDAVRGERVKDHYVSLEPDAVTRDLAVKLGRRTVKYYAVGKVDGGAKTIVIFVHGRNTGRATGIDDWIHGGNFNRIKNLMMRSGGVYLSPDFANFGRTGANQVASLIHYVSAQSPGAPVFLACGSLGARLCWRLMRDDSVRPLLGGLMLLDPVMDRDDIRFAARLAPRDRVPILMTGSREDSVVGFTSQRDLFRALKQQVPDYPIRYVLFSAGTHGLSWRMVDWRDTLNWMLAVDGR